MSEELSVNEYVSIGEDINGAPATLRSLRNIFERGFWYVATPYSKYPGGLEEAFKDAAAFTANLIRCGVPAFSPIAHSHPIAMFGGIDPLDHDIWLPADRPMMNAASGLIVAKLPTWDKSFGVAVEIQVFSAAYKPVIYVDPGELRAACPS